MSDGQPGSNDPFRPPEIPTEVHCIHCNQEYESYLIKWVPHDENKPEEGFWCCPTPGCDGKGFGFDIFPTDPEWRDENGEQWFIEDFDEDDEEYDQDLEEDEEVTGLEESEDEDFEWSPEWEQAVYGDGEPDDEPSEPEGPPAEGRTKPPNIPFDDMDEDDLPF